MYVVYICLEEVAVCVWLIFANDDFFGGIELNSPSGAHAVSLTTRSFVYLVFIYVSFLNRRMKYEGLKFYRNPS